MTILYSYKTEEEKKKAEEALVGHEVVFYENSLQKGEWDGSRVEVLCVFVDSLVGKEELDKLPDLKFIATKSTGFDHIDLTETKARGVEVANVPAYGEHTVAEFTFALLLTLSRNIIAANEKVVREGLFNPDELAGFDLFGKTLGVLGTGRIGKNVIKIAKGFSMNIVAYDAYPDNDFAKELGFEYKTLDEVLGEADIITLHLPENEETHHIINKDKVAKMKKGVCIINTARGSLIETEALVWGLEEGIIAEAGVDVLSEEGNVDDEMQLLSKPHPNAENMKTLLLNHYLIEHPKVIITPHTAFNTHEAVARILETSLENIKNFLAGKPENLVS